ncbi:MULTISPECIES: hypothetical protein [Aliagarivorans]|uniref:hypothetical protein n=1 Tax=Aliagarivorans TaxID=882379 RepID=UPI0012F716DE|nr:MULTISPECIES: hypothetical protein [Aliagarivorans]
MNYIVKFFSLAFFLTIYHILLSQFYNLDDDLMGVVICLGVVSMYLVEMALGLPVGMGALSLGREHKAERIFLLVSLIVCTICALVWQWPVLSNPVFS